MHQGQIELGGRIALACRQRVPLARLDQILGHGRRMALGQQQAELDLRIGVALRGGGFVPLQGLYQILGQTVALGVNQAQMELRRGIALRRRFGKPMRSPGTVLRRTLAVGIHKAQIGLHIRQPLLGGALVPLQR